MIHDAFQPLSFWNGFMQPPHWEGVLLDTHVYQMFSDAVSLCFVLAFLGVNDFLRKITNQTNNISSLLVVLDLDYPLPPYGPLSGSGLLRPTTAQSISMGVASVPVTMVHSPVQRVSEAALVLRVKPQPSVRATRASFDNSGKPRSPHTNKDRVGFSGLGKLKSQMNGHIKLDWLMVGFRRTPPIASSQAFVADFVFLFFGKCRVCDF